MTTFRKQHLKFWFLLFFVFCGTCPVLAQDIVKPIYQGGDIDLETLSLPPMDEGSLSFTPPKPELAVDITRLSECQKAKGKWQSQIFGNAEESNIYEQGCVKDGLKVGRWVMTASQMDSDVPKTKALGYSWYIEGKASGYQVQFVAENAQLLLLKSMKNGKKDGPSFEWYANGTLHSVYHYSDDIKDGSFEIYESNCLPSVRGEFAQGVPSGIWESYFANGVLMSRIDFSKTMSIDAETQASWAEQFDYKKGVKIGEGYIIGNPFEGGVLKVGEWTTYTMTGHQWLKLEFDGLSGELSRNNLLSLCTLSSDPSFDHEEVAVSCIEDGREVLRREYYQTGELQAKILSPEEPYGRVFEYHPSGEVLAEYEMSKGMPKGPVVFFDRQGEAYGRSEFIARSGEWTRYWYTGKRRENGEYKNGFKDGKWTRYNEDGTKIAEETYRHGKLHGQSRTWFANGMVDTIMPYDEGVLEGKVTGFWTFGNPAWEVKMDAGRPQGKAYEYTGNGSVSVEKNYRMAENGSVAFAKYYYPNGELRAEGEENAFGTRLGVWKLYLLNGKLWRSVDYDALYDTESGVCNDIYGGEYLIDEEKRETGCVICEVNRESPSHPRVVKVDRWTWYNEKGEVEKTGGYKLDRMDDEWQFFYPNGKLMLKGYYEIDKAMGQWAGYFNNGRVKFEGSFKDGQESGIWRSYFALDGKKLASKGRFELGKREGMWAWYHENGEVREEGEFEAGKEEGEWLSYYESGKKMGKGAYMKGKREGLWTWWREDGQLWRKSYYRAGKEESLPQEFEE